MSTITNSAGRLARALCGGAVIALALAAVAGAAETDPLAVTDGQFRSALGHRLDGASRTRDEADLALGEWYAKTGFRPLWIGSEGPNGKAHDFVRILGQAAKEGLDPADYRAEEVKAALAAEPVEAELRLSRALVRYVSDLRTGRLSPRLADPALFLQPGEIDRLAILQAADEAPTIGQAIERFTPANPIYRRLRRILAEYRSIAAAGGWPSVPDGPSLKPGMRDDRVPALRRRLMATGDLTYRSADTELYEEALARAVQRFQQRHGLESDGVVGPRTRAELNVSVQRRIDQILVNMERWRWMPDDLGDRYIMVNLAGFELEVVEHGAVVMDMRVIAGKPYRRTPIFSSSMTYLVLNPTWTVPPTVVKHDLLPKARQNPAYLENQKIRVFLGWQEDSAELAPASVDWNAVDRTRVPYRFRQEPGPGNALGRVKFMFPNRFDVYLHDTPSRELFDKQVRSFSSGCVRLERPLALAEYLLKDVPGWNRKRIDQVVASAETTTVRLPNQVPVHLTYSTVWFGEGGTIHFRDDVYARDDLLFQALFGYPPGRKQVPQDR